MDQSITKIVPYQYALYILSYLLTIYVMVLALADTGYLGLAPVLAGIFGLCFLIALLFKYPLMDLITSMHYRERMALVFVYAIFFIAPLVLLAKADLAFCLISLALATSVFLQRSSQFLRLYLLNAMIFIVTLAKNPELGWLYVEGFILLLMGCFLFDYFYFKAAKYESSEFVGISDLARLAVRLFFPLLVAGFALQLITPQLAPHHLNILSTSPSRVEKGTAAPISTSSIISLAYHLIVLIIIILVVLAMLNWLRKKLSKRRLATTGRAQASFGKLRKFVEEKFVRKWRSHLGDARATIIFYYCLFCQELGRLGYPRPAYQTPQEYNEWLKNQIRPGEQELDHIRHSFERARYSSETIARQEAQAFKDLVDRVTNRIKETN